MSETKQQKAGKVIGIGRTSEIREWPGDRVIKIYNSKGYLGTGLLCITLGLNHLPKKTRPIQGVSNPVTVLNDSIFRHPIFRAAKTPSVRISGQKGLMF